MKNRNTKDLESEYPEALAAVVDNHHVDDYLDSLGTIDEALQVTTVHTKAGFHIRNWASSSNDVLSLDGDSERDQVKRFKTHTSSASKRILGMSWFPESFEFMCSGLFREEKIPTKRYTNEKAAPPGGDEYFFEPLGLAAFVGIHGKILLQKCVASKH